MASGDVVRSYATRVALTQVNLDGLASSATHVVVWESDAIDAAAAGYTSYRITAEIKVASAGLAAGEIRMSIVEELNDSAWPDVFDGTESGETITDTEIRDALLTPIAVTATDTAASRTYYLRGVVVDPPRKFVVVISQSTGAALETSGDPNKVYVQGIRETVTP